MSDHRSYLGLPIMDALVQAQQLGHQLRVTHDHGRALRYAEPAHPEHVLVKVFAGKVMHTSVTQPTVSTSNTGDVES